MKPNFKIRVVAALLCLVMLFAVSCSGSDDTTPTSLDTTNDTTNDTTDDTTDTTSESEQTENDTTDTELESEQTENDTTDTESESEQTENDTTDTESESEQTENDTTDTESESEKPENGTKKIVTETKKLYETAETVGTLDIAYYEDTPEILLISTDVLTSDFFKGVLTSFASFEITETESAFTITRSNGAFCTIDFVDKTIFFNDLDLFRSMRSDSMSDFLATSYLDSKGNNIYFKTTNNKDIAGQSIYLELAGRGIPLDIYEGEKYIPLQTINDLFLIPYNFACVYNGKDIYLAQQGKVNASLIEQYYSAGPVERSEALAHFTTDEFILAMELNYGLQDEHGVDVGFGLYLDSIGLLDDFTSSDATISSLALASLAFGYLADKHTALNMPSPYTGSPAIDKSKAEVDASFVNYARIVEAITMARATVMPEGTPAYQEIGNTAYITFDAFTLDPIRFQDYSEASLQAGDTFGLIIYAHSQINREGSPIENVVIDLSCNGGGAVDAAVYVVGWMLGYCDLSMTNPMTGGFSTTSYLVDVNLDGVFDSKDTIADKNLYCITSPVSFSCGNLVPALLKESGRVTMLGGTSSGGACAVTFLTLADGSSIQISSPKHLTVVSNGSYYTIDRGVEPHYYFTKYENYYKRDEITAFIKSLL